MRAKNCAIARPLHNCQRHKLIASTAGAYGPGYRLLLLCLAFQLCTKTAYDTQKAVLMLHCSRYSGQSAVTRQDSLEVSERIQVLSLTLVVVPACNDQL